MRILVVGGSGFIGTRLIENLAAAAHSVTNFDLAPSSLPRVSTLTGDVQDVDALADAARGHDAIINLAAAHRDDVRPVSLYETINVDGARSVVDAANRAGIRRILFTSSVAVYGLDNGDADEDSKPRPFNEYGRTKLAAERVYEEWAVEDASRSLVIVRPSVVFGEGNRGNVYTLARQVASRRFLMVGDGSNRKSMTYVGNLVDYLADALDAPPGVRLVNYADKPDLSTRELIDTLRNSMDLGSASRIRVPLPLALAAGHAFDALAWVTRRSFPISAVRVRKFVAETTVNTERLEGTRYRPRTSLREGIRRTIEAEFPASERSRRG